MATIDALQSQTFQNFRGMNRASDRFNMSPEFAYDIYNGYIKKDIKTGLGVIQQRSGITKFNTVTFTNPALYVFEAKWNSGAKDILIREGTRWAKFDGVDTFANFDTGRSSDVRGQAVMFGNECIMVDGATPRVSTSAYAITNLTDVTKGTVTVTIASPAVFSFTAHGLVAGQAVYITTTGALPTGLTAGTTYYVISAGLTADAFEVSATLGGSAVNTSGSQSGTHTLHAFDGNMPTDVTAIHVHNHKVWLNSTANPMKAYFSKSDSANLNTSFTGTSDAGTLDFSRILPAGDTLIGFKTFAENFLVFIFKKYVVVFTAGTDPTAFALQQIVPLNCISIHGVAQIGNDLAVPSLEGVNSFRSSLSNQDLDIDDLTKFIAPLYRELLGTVSDTSTISAGFSHNLNHYYIALPGSPDTILVYSLDIKNFVGRWQGYEANSFCERQDGTMLIGGDGFVYNMNTGADDLGTAISFQYSFPFIYFGDADRNKAVRQFEGVIIHDAQTSNFTVHFDYFYGTGNESSSSLTEDITLSANVSLYREALYRVGLYRASGNTRYQTSNILGRGKQVAVDIYHNNLDASITIPYFVIRYKSENIKIR